MHLRGLIKVLPCHTEYQYAGLPAVLPFDECMCASSLLTACFMLPIIIRCVGDQLLVTYCINEHSCHVHQNINRHILCTFFPYIQTPPKHLPSVHTPTKPTPSTYKHTPTHILPPPHTHTHSFLPSIPDQVQGNFAFLHVFPITKLRIFVCLLFVSWMCRCAKYLWSSKSILSDLNHL